LQTEKLTFVSLGHPKDLKIQVMILGIQCAGFNQDPTTARAAQDSILLGLQAPQIDHKDVSMLRRSGLEGRGNPLPSPNIENRVFNQVIHRLVPIGTPTCRIAEGPHARLVALMQAADSCKVSWTGSDGFDASIC